MVETKLRDQAQIRLESLRSKDILISIHRKLNLRRSTLVSIPLFTMVNGKEIQFLELGPSIINMVASFSIKTLTQARIAAVMIDFRE